MANFGYAVGDGFLGKNFYGISETNLEGVKQTILSFQKQVEADLDELCNEVNSGVVSGAVKGEALTQAIQSFVNAIKQEAKDWSSYINTYAAAIDEVISQFKITQTQSASALDDSSSSVSSQAERYNYGGSTGSSSAS